MLKKKEERLVQAELEVLELKGKVNGIEREVGELRKTVA